ncbi:optineurin-like isoform X2 [Acanthaster planci]|uniref:Optineurin-like isoform X2 n=1 Tax=Acanthaster planci TaxID=133434 RepID=A0A8B7XMC4_ACAPL|nr:optineurin-like isoform X2 [Acanthaster planci]
MPRRNSPPTPTTPGSSTNGSEASEGDFVILPRPSLDTVSSTAGSHHHHHPADLQLRSQVSPTATVNGGPNMVTMMQYDQLVSTVRGMKEENNMLRVQLTDMVHTMENRTKEFLQMKNSNRQVTERCKELRKLANLEITRLRNQVQNLEDQQQADDQEKSALKVQNEELKEKVHFYESKLQRLEAELKEKNEEVMVFFERDNSKSSSEDISAQMPISLLSQLKKDIKDVQGTRADIQTNFATLEQVLQKSAAELRHYKQQADLLVLEKQDLLALNNELQTKVSVYSNGASWQGSRGTPVSAVGSDVTSESDTLQGAMEGSGSQFQLPPPPFSPGQALHKSRVALQDVLLQLQAERDKVASLMEDLKKERMDRNKSETTLMEQLHARSGEHDIALEELKKKHQEQVEELVGKLDELAIANQEPHHSMELKQQVRSLVCELQERENVLQQQEHSVKDLRATNEALKSKIALYHDELEEVRKQDSQMIETLREELKRQQDTYQLEKQQKLIERMNHDKLMDDHKHLRQEYNQLFADYDNLNRLYEEQRSRSTQGVSAAAVRELAEQRDNLTAQLMSAEEAIGAKQNQLEKVQRELQEAKTELETVPVLQAQAEIYKNDFDAEREAREKAHTEREALMDELEAVKELNQQMQDQLASHAQTQLQQMQHRHSNTLGGSSGGGSGGGVGSTLYERFISRPLNALSGAQARRNDQGYAGGRDYGSGGPYEEEPYDTIPEMDPGVDVDQAGRGTADLANAGRMSPGVDQSHSQQPITNPTCPKCQNEFPDIDTLQIHMLDCIR